MELGQYDQARAVLEAAVATKPKNPKLAVRRPTIRHESAMIREERMKSWHGLTVDRGSFQESLQNDLRLCRKKLREALGPVGPQRKGAAVPAFGRGLTRKAAPFVPRECVSGRSQVVQPSCVVSVSTAYLQVSRGLQPQSLWRIPTAAVS